MGVTGGPKIMKNMRNRRISMSTCGFKKTLAKKYLTAKIGEFPPVFLAMLETLLWKSAGALDPFR